MSADNWTECPKCSVLFDEKAAALETKAENSYGKIPVEQYLNVLQEAKEARQKADNPPEDTLREDYELGILNGEFYVIYRAGCDQCGFQFKYTHEIKDLLKEDV